MYVFIYFLIVLFIGFVWLLGNLDLLWISENLKTTSVRYINNLCQTYFVHIHFSLKNQKNQASSLPIPKLSSKSFHESKSLHACISSIHRSSFNLQGLYLSDTDFRRHLKEFIS